jgi:hypothetical protein
VGRWGRAGKAGNVSPWKWSLACESPVSEPQTPSTPSFHHSLALCQSRRPLSLFPWFALAFQFSINPFLPSHGSELYFLLYHHQRLSAPLIFQHHHPLQFTHLQSCILYPFLNRAPVHCRLFASNLFSLATLYHVLLARLQAALSPTFGRLCHIPLISIFCVIHSTAPFRWPPHCLLARLVAGKVASLLQVFTTRDCLALGASFLLDLTAF